jgi:3-methyladenine DNA glycosylase AlkD
MTDSPASTPSPLTAAAVRAALHAIADPVRAVAVRRYFKTAPGEYGAGDEFLGPPVPAQRAVAQRFRGLPPEEAETLLQDSLHECRFVALAIWGLQVSSARTPLALRRDRCERYLRLRRFVNNWDLVDSSAPALLGKCLLYSHDDRRILDELAAENHLWSQRIAIIATQAFIRRGEFADTFRLAETLLSHRHDLMHKAVGWMLREIGDQNLDALHEFLAEHLPRMPRTALRYAIEKLPLAERKAYLAKP